jgi:hypothetical protein
VLARRTTCVVDHGSTYPVPYGATMTEHYSGVVSVDDLTFGSAARALAEFAVEWPEATVSTSATLDLVATPDSYDVTIALVAKEGDQQVAERRWHETFARDLA